MAENKNGYIGKIPNKGNMVVEAPNQIKGGKSGTVHKGSDLRCGKK